MLCRALDLDGFFGMTKDNRRIFQTMRFKKRKTMHKNVKIYNISFHISYLVQLLVSTCGNRKIRINKNFNITNRN